MRPYLQATTAMGIPWQRQPEVFLRLPVVLAFAALVALVYAWGLRRGGAVTAVLAAGAMASAPLLQFFAFEGKVYSVAALASVAYVIFGETSLQQPTRSRLLALSAFGVVLAWMSLWSALFVLAMPLWAARARLAGAMPWRPAILLVTTSIPGLLMAALQGWYVSTTFAFQSNQHTTFDHGLVNLLWGIGRNFWSGPDFLDPGIAPGRLWVGCLLLVVAVAVCVVSWFRRGAPARVFPLHAGVLALVAMIVVATSRPGFMLGRYEVPVMAPLLLAIATLRPRLSWPLLAAFIALGTLCLPATAARIEGKSSTRGMMREVRARGDARSEIVLTRYFRGWDPLHRYTGFFYGQLLSPAWRVVDYPSLAPAGADFMLFGSLVRSPQSARLLLNPDNPRLVPLLDAAHVHGVWVLSPATEDPAVLHYMLRRAGFELESRRLCGGYPTSWLLHYVRPR